MKKTFFTLFIVLVSSMLFANPTLELGNISTSGSSYSFPNAVVSGSDISSIVVGFADPTVSGDLITLPTISGFTAQGNSVSKLITCSGKTATEIQTYIRNIAFSATSTKRIKIIVSDEVVANSTYYSAANDHYYQFVENTVTWPAAYNNAKNLTFLGRQGYLATITNATEENFLLNICTLPGWLGGTRLQCSNLSGQYYTTISTTAANDYYIWACGPEIGTHFYDCKMHSTTCNDNARTNNYYTDWCDNQPDASGYEYESNIGETCITNRLQEGSNQWNDLEWSHIQNTHNRGYFVEFGNLSYGDNSSLPSTVAVDMQYIGPSPSINLGCATLSTGSYTFPDASITGDHIRSIRIEFGEKANGTITVPNTAGFTASGNDTLKYIYIATGTTTNAIQTYIQSIHFTTNDTNTVKITIDNGIPDNQIFYLPATDHYYEMVNNTTISWEDAYKAAKSKSFMGQQGYLTTIMNSTEDNFLFTNFTNPAWIGGTRLIPTGLSGQYYSSFDTSYQQSENYWYWACGPEINTIFYSCKTAIGCTNTATAYVNWSNNQPDGSYTNFSNQIGECCLAHKTSSSSGAWNDLIYNNAAHLSTETFAEKGYIIEYGNALKGHTSSLPSTSAQTTGKIKQVTLSATISGTTAICPASSAKLAIAFVGKAPFTYAINNGTSKTSNSNTDTVSVSPTENTTYTVTSLSDSYSCPGIEVKTLSGSAAISILTPNVNQPDTQTICSGSTFSTTFSSTFAITNYKWQATTIPSGCSISTTSDTGNISNVTVTNNNTTYKNIVITVTPQATTSGVTCYGPIKTFTIIVNPLGQVNQPDSITVCSTDPLAVSFNTNNTGDTTTYKWTNSNTSIGLVASGDGNITTFVTTENHTTQEVATINVTPTFSHRSVSCSGTSKAFTVTVNPLPDITISGDNTIFLGEPTFLTATGGINYSWSCKDAGAIIKNQTTNGSSTKIIPSDTGYFRCKVIVTSNEGCQDSAFYYLRVKPCGPRFPVTDIENNSYPTKPYNRVCWTVTNLRSTKYSDNTNIPTAMKYYSDVYPNQASNVSSFGLLYDWASATNSTSTLPVYGICPTGWMLPTMEEFTGLQSSNLYTVYDCNDLHSTDYWLNADGTNITGFDMRPAGMFESAANRFINLNGDTYFITADSFISSSSEVINIPCSSYGCSQMLIKQVYKTDALSVRCVKHL